MKATKEEVRKEFLDAIRHLVFYWANVKDEYYDRNLKNRLDGFAHSILCLFDGVTDSTPPLSIVVSVDESDPECEYIDGMIINDDCHLHELYHKK